MIDRVRQRVIAPPPTGWAIRVEDDRVQYMLALCCDTIEEANAAARDEADRFVVAFAEQIAEWITPSEDLPHGLGYGNPNSAAKEEWKRMPLPEGKDAKRPPFKTWRAEQILKMAKRERPLPYDEEKI